MAISDKSALGVSFVWALLFPLMPGYSQTTSGIEERYQRAREAQQRQDFKTALEATGIEFTGTPEDGPGIRLRTSRRTE